MKKEINFNINLLLLLLAVFFVALDTPIPGTGICVVGVIYSIYKGKKEKKKGNYYYLIVFVTLIIFFFLSVNKPFGLDTPTLNDLWVTESGKNKGANLRFRFC